MSLSTISALFHELTPLERVTLGTRAPAAWLVTGEDRLRITARNDAASVVVRVSGRFLTADGVVVPIVFDLAPATDLSASSIDYALGDGWILNLTARVQSGAPQVGQTYLVVDVVRGSGAVAIVLGTLISNFITAAAPSAWPGSIIASPTAEPGALVALSSPDPAAGAEWTITIPAGVRFRVRNIIATLVTDATVANRDLTIVFTCGGVVVQAATGPANQAASTTRRYSAFPGSVRGPAASAPESILPIGELTMRSGDTIASVTTGLVAGDNWGVATAYGERFLDV